MNIHMIWKLVYKDWQLFKWYVVGYVLLGILSAFSLTVPVSFAFHAGVVLLITALLAASAHIAMISIVTERKEYQLSFIMGLPINPAEYAASKLLGSLGIYLMCWLPIVISTVLVVALSNLPNGLLPLILMSATAILVSTTILVCVGLLTKTEAPSIIVMVILNLLFNLFLFAVASLPSVGPHINTATAVFNQEVMLILALELLVLMLTVSTTLYLKARKSCFL